MDKDRVKGASNKAAGTVKEAAGKVTGDKSLEAEGKGQKAPGKPRARSAKRRTRCEKSPNSPIQAFEWGRLWRWAGLYRCTAAPCLPASRRRPTHP